MNIFYRVIKLNMLFMLLLTVSVYGKVKAQRITLSVKNESLENLFSKLSKLTKYKVMYVDDLMIEVPSVSFNLKNATVNDVFNTTLKDTDFNHKIVSGTVIIKRKPKLVQAINSVVNVQKQIRGRVFDSDGISLPGATVLLKNKERAGIMTNTDGEFSILANIGDVIQISFIGYISREITVTADGASEIDVLLDRLESQLGEVVVVGYGTQKKENLTGSVSVVKGDEIAERPVTNTALALQGAAPGLSVVNRGGAPGDNDGDVQIKIRGTGTLNNSSPLVLVDGIPQKLSSVSPSEIESISILKDAASASIYGSRAGNGVILVTTKRGIKEGVSVTYDAYAGFQAKNFWPESASPGDYLRLHNEAYENAGLPIPYSDEWIKNVEAGTEPLKYPFTNWADAVFDDRAFQQSHSLNVSSGGKSGRILVALNYVNQDGIIKRHNFERYSVRLNADLYINKKLTLNTDLLYRKRNYTGVGQSPAVIMQSILHSKQSVVGVYPNGSHDLVGGWINSYALIDKSGESTKNNDDMVATVGLKYDIVDGLSLKGSLSINNNILENRLFRNRLEMTNYYTGEIMPVGERWAQNFLEDSRQRTFEPSYKLYADYDKTFGQHEMHVLLGYDEIHNRFRGVGASRDNFYSNELHEINAGDSKNWKNWGSSEEWRLRSFFSRVNYVFNDKYLFEANLRYDGSSRFSKGKKYGIFPSFSAGWKVGEESFLKDNVWVKDLKLRASWGQLGNQEIPLYRNVGVYDLDQGYNFNDNIVVGAGQKIASNPDITWESTTMTDIGVDFGILNNKFTIVADYFWRKTNDILFQLPIAPSIGIEAPTQNSASVENKGWELAINYNGNNGKEFKYSIGFNISDVKNKITDLKGTGPYYRDKYIIWQEGQSINTLYGYKTHGLYRTQADLDKYAKVNEQVTIGDIIYEDINEDGVINSDDRAILGNMDPRFPIGLNFGASYKGFDFSMFWQGVLKAQSNLDGALIEGPNWQNYTTSDMVKNRFHETRNPEGTMPRVSYGNAWNIHVSDFWIQDTKYIRLKNVQLGYTLPSFILDKLKINKIRMYVSGENLITFSGTKWVDPEFPAGRLQYYPQSKVVTAGLSLLF